MLQFDRQQNAVVVWMIFFCFYHLLIPPINASFFTLFFVGGQSYLELSQLSPVQRDLGFQSFFSLSKVGDRGLLGGR